MRTSTKLASIAAAAALVIGTGACAARAAVPPPVHRVPCESVALTLSSHTHEVLSLCGTNMPTVNIVCPTPGRLLPPQGIHFSCTVTQQRFQG